MGGIGDITSRWYSSLTIAPFCNCGRKVAVVTQSSVSNYIHTKISFDSGTKVAMVTQYRISYYFHATVSFNCGTKVAVVTRYQLPNYFHITIYPLTPLHKSSHPPSALQFLFLHKPSIEVTKVTESQNSNYIHTTCHVWMCFSNRINSR